MMSCISASSTGVINDSTCVNQLKSWGMCNTSSYGIYYLNYSGLSCAGTGSTAGTGWFTGASTSYNSASYYYSSSTDSYYSASGYTAIRMISYATGVLYQYAMCTIEQNDQVVQSGAYCCFTNAGSISLSEWIYSGTCTDGHATYADVSGLTNNSSATCTTDFQTYFSTGLSTGYCSGNTIVVEGTGALLIAQACYGDTTINSSHLLTAFCGVLITSCNGDSGFYHNGLSADPMTFANNGSSYWCELCPDGSINNLGNASGVLSVHADSSVSGITSCYGSPNGNTVSGTDTSGSYKLTITGDCPYSE